MHGSSHMTVDPRIPTDGPRRVFTDQADILLAPSTKRRIQGGWGIYAAIRGYMQLYAVWRLR